MTRITNPIALRDCPIQELFVCVRQAWQTVIFGEIESMRKTMKNLSKACVASTMKDFETWNSEEQGVLRCALNGTLYTHDALIHTGKVEGANCKYCDAPDSIRHRHWECPHFEDLWETCLSKISIPSEQLPDCVLLHGWIPRNPFVTELKTLLCSLPNFIPLDFAPTTSCTEVFTDGSCVHPTKPDQRIATWGVVVGHNNSFKKIAEGGVPGYHQTSLRGRNLGSSISIEFCSTTRGANSNLD